MTAAKIDRVVDPFTPRQHKLYDAAIRLLTRTGVSVVAYVADDKAGEHLHAVSGDLKIDCYRVETYETKREVNLTVAERGRTVFDVVFVQTFVETSVVQQDFVRTDAPGSWEGWLLSRRPRPRRSAPKPEPKGDRP